MAGFSLFSVALLYPHLTLTVGPFNNSIQVHTHSITYNIPRRESRVGGTTPARGRAPGLLRVAKRLGRACSRANPQLFLGADPLCFQGLGRLLRATEGWALRRATNGGPALGYVLRAYYR